MRVPLADGTLVAVPGARRPGRRCSPSLLTLSDVMGTGHHAALAAGSGPGRTVVVVGDGAVGLCGVLAADASARSGSSPCPGTPTGRRSPATSAPPTSSPSAGDEGVAAVQELLGGIGADAVLECVGTKESMEQAIDAARPGGRVGYVGVPAGGAELPIRQLFASNVSSAAAWPRSGRTSRNCWRTCWPAPSTRAASSTSVLPLDEAPEAYAAMDERRAIKTMLPTLTSAGELAVQRGQHRARHGVGVVAADHC